MTAGRPSGCLPVRNGAGGGGFSVTLQRPAERLGVYHHQPPPLYKERALSASLFVRPVRTA